MSPMDEDTDELAGEYVLGTLSAGERRRVELSLPHEPALRAAVAGWEARLLPLAALAPPAEPSPQVWARVEASLAAARRPAPAPPTGARPWWERLGVWRALAATGFAAAAFMAVVPRLPAPVAAPRYMVVLAAPNNMAPGWIVQADTAGALKLVPLQANQLFEITLEPKNGSPIGRPTGPILYIGRAVRML
jgi:anti-sigma-K factor RskA